MQPVTRSLPIMVANWQFCGQGRRNRRINLQRVAGDDVLVLAIISSRGLSRSGLFLSSIRAIAGFQHDAGLLLGGDAVDVVGCLREHRLVGHRRMSNLCSWQRVFNRALTGPGGRLDAHVVERLVEDDALRELEPFDEDDAQQECDDVDGPAPEAIGGLPQRSRPGA